LSNTDKKSNRQKEKRLLPIYTVDIRSRSCDHWLFCC